MVAQWVASQPNSFRVCAEFHMSSPCLFLPGSQVFSHRPKSQKHDSSCIGDTKLPLGVNEFVSLCTVPYDQPTVDLLVFLTRGSCGVYASSIVATNLYKFTKFGNL